MVRRYTVRQSFTVPIGTKAKIKTAARARGMSMSAYLRHITNDHMAINDLENVAAKIEARAAMIR